MTTKIQNLLESVRTNLSTGNYVYTSHANKRLQQRRITRAEIKHILLYGYHEKRKDKFEEIHQCWNYSIRGETVDRDKMRIIVSFHGDILLVITAIRIESGK